MELIISGNGQDLNTVPQAQSVEPCQVLLMPQGKETSFDAGLTAPSPDGAVIYAEGGYWLFI